VQNNPLLSGLKKRGPWNRNSAKITEITDNIADLNRRLEYFKNQYAEAQKILEFAEIVKEDHKKWRDEAKQYEDYWNERMFQNEIYYTRDLPQFKRQQKALEGAYEEKAREDWANQYNPFE